MSAGCMKASIEFDDFHLLMGRSTGTPLTQAMVDAVRELLKGGGTGDWEDMSDRLARRYTFEGPPELVRPVIQAAMAFIHDVETRKVRT